MSAVKQPMPSGVLKSVIDSPLGSIEIGVNTDTSPDTLWYVEFINGPTAIPSKHQPSHPIFDAVEQQLLAYFEGRPFDFKSLLVYQSNYGTEFQKEVWSALTDIPVGETWSYGQLAHYINRPKAVRAVGAANGRNPLALIVPCHRVIGANGTLTGYAGGLPLKQKLLAFEHALVQQKV